ncbi:hypothetical protein GA0070610_1755 [Micromonospora echinofusca]|uniref:Uncharacterized protein n=2 Tax=Micromonospora echinofusca TaxID=47858 RepID=A0A1C5G6Y9_MICEH|nr:hypothetical protein GA0070610_1755 [Micromonospora echinofusca]
MGKSTIQAGKRAAVDECGPRSCMDEDGCCVHCEAPRDEPHQPDCKPDCKNAGDLDDEPDDECDARPAEEESSVEFLVTSWGGGAVRVVGNREGVWAYCQMRVARRYREQVAEKMLAWLAEGAPSPHTVVAWHGETEFWSVDAIA